MKTLAAVLATIMILNVLAWAQTPATRSAASQPATSTSPASDAPVKLDLSAGLTYAQLAPHVGKRVIVSGLWCPEGMMSGYVHGGKENQGEPIYLKATREQGHGKQTELCKTPNDTPAVVEGTLNFYKAPGVVKRSEVQSIPSHFYFDVEQATVKFVKK